MIRVSTPSIPARVGILIPNLGRENENEVVAAARAIEKSLTSAGLTLYDLAERLSTNQVSPLRPTNFGDLARACRDLGREALTSRERAFVAQMCARGFSYRPTPRQAEWLEAILSRLQGRAAA